MMRWILLMITMAMIVESAVPTEKQVECAFCELAVQEVLGLGSMNLSESQLSQYLESTFCSLFSSAKNNYCDKLVENLPILMLLLDDNIHPGKVCVSMNMCDQPEEALAADPQPLPAYTIDLDLPPSQRYTLVFQNEIYKEGMRTIYGVLQVLLDAEVLQGLMDLGNLGLLEVEEDYRMEIEGIARACDVPSAYILFINLFYEITNGLACTSIVVQNQQGNPLWSRNQDLGYGMGFTHLLRNQTYHLTYAKNGTNIYQAVSFAGFIGTPSAILPGKWNLAVNSRFYRKSSLTFVISVFKEIMAGKQHINTWEVRRSMERGLSYGEVVQHLSSIELVTSSYFIIGGVKKDEGVVLERNQTGVVLARHLDSDNGVWFLAQTNYDYGKKPPFYDDRRYYIEKAIPHYCGLTGGLKPGVVNFSCMYQSLSTTHVLNLLTLYTAQAQNDPFITHYARRYCHGNTCAL